MSGHGFGFIATNHAGTVAVTVQMNWDEGVPEDEVTETLTRAYASAFARAIKTTTKE